MRYLVINFRLRSPCNLCHPCRWLQGWHRWLQGQQRWLQRRHRQLGGQHRWLQEWHRQMLVRHRQLFGWHRWLQGWHRQLQEQHRWLREWHRYWGDIISCWGDISGCRGNVGTTPQDAGHLWKIERFRYNSLHLMLFIDLFISRFITIDDCVGDSQEYKCLQCFSLRHEHQVSRNFPVTCSLNVKTF